MQATEQGALSVPRRLRQASRRFRRTRPFWAAVWTIAGGTIIFYLPYAPPGMLLHIGVGGIGGLACGAIIAVMGLFMMFLPSQRHVAGAIAGILGVASFPLTNLGGLFVGMLLSILGGSMAFGWMPEKPERKRRLFRKLPATATPALEVAEP
ncbi:hypothetical protein GCM10027589_33790 [Actinocorallia lasiicapitis]